MINRALLSTIALTISVIAATSTPVSAQSCDNLAGIWQIMTLNGDPANDMGPMTVNQNGCEFRGTFAGNSGVQHVVMGSAGNGGLMTVTRQDTAGCQTQMYGDMFVALDGVLWYSINSTQGACGLPAAYKEIRRFRRISIRERRERPDTDGGTRSDRVFSEPNRAPAGLSQPSERYVRAERDAALEARQGMEQAARGRDTGDVATAEAGAKRAEAAAREFPDNATAQANARDAREAADRAKELHGAGSSGESKGGNAEPKGGGGGNGNSESKGGGNTESKGGKGSGDFR